MKVVINYKDKIYIQNRVANCMFISEINLMLDNLGIPLHISKWKDSTKDEQIIGSYEYMLNRKKRLNLPKPVMFFDEFIIDEMKEGSNNGKEN